MAVYKLKAFARFQLREGLDDAALCRAVRDVERGLIDAELGGGLIKQRVARMGQGKRGGFRTLIAYRRGDRVVFLFGFAKHDLDNVGDDEVAEWRAIGARWLRASADEIATAIAEERLMEVNFEEE